MGRQKNEEIEKKLHCFVKANLLGAVDEKEGF
jgi:hypothetical protein